MIECWSAVTDGAGMADAMLVDLADNVRRHPWWLARARLVIRLLNRVGVRPGASILDAGCGWGVTLESLEQQGYRVSGLDASRGMLDRLDSPKRRLVLADLARPLPIREQFDGVLALDVIEHLDDDRAAVATLANLLLPGGVMLVSVPARPEMYGEFDAVQGHRRRYTMPRLAAAFHNSGLALERLFWWGAWLVPVLKRQRSRSLGKPGDTPDDIYRRHLRLPSRPARTIAAAAFRIEEPLALAGLLRTGTSLFAVARKN
jgi:SAM-dependent methyltransferase